MKKICLLFMISLIYLLSSTAGLQVINPNSWFHLENTYFTIDFSHLTKQMFYEPYKIVLNETNLILHKICHFFFFGTLSILFLWNVNKVKKPYFLAWILTTFYGLTDEIHQFSVPGRTGTFQDVLIDSISALIWLGVCFGLLQFYKIAKKRKIEAL